MVDLRSALRQQIYSTVDSVNPKAKYKALIVDDVVQRIMSLCVDTSDLLNRHVANVQRLDAKRQSETYLEALYICEYSEFTKGCITADFTRRPPRYKCAHVLFLGGTVSEIQMTTFRNSSISRFLERVDVAPLNFLPLERQVFSLGDPWANDRLYNVQCKQDIVPYVDQIGQQLAHVCLNIGEVPYIRYLDNGVSPVPELVASALGEHVGKLRNSYMTPEREAAPRSTLLIVDRSLDLFAPFMHEFSFQALAYDVLQWGGEFNEFVSKDRLTKGKLTEVDLDWTSLRHHHITEVTEKLTARVHELKTANPHFADPNSDVTVRDVRNMMAALPDFVKSRDTVSLNLQVALECMDEVERQKLQELAEFEQTAALGITSEGRRPAEPFTDQLVALLARPDVTREAKMRLLAVYVLSRKHGLFAKDWARLGRHSQLSRADLDSLTNLSAIGGAMVKFPDHKPDLPQQFGYENPEEQFLFARYVPGLKQVTEQLVKGVLSTEQFPYVNGDAPTGTEQAAEAATSLRNPRQRATWAQPTNGSSSGPGKKEARRKLLIFVIGGFTAAEARAMYELSTHYPRDILLGGNDWLTANTFLEFLSRQKMARAELHLPIDAPPRPVPEYLSASDRENRPDPTSATAPKSNTPPVASSYGDRPIAQSLQNSALQQPLATPKSGGMKSRIKGAFRKKS